MTFSNIFHTKFHEKIVYKSTKKNPNRFHIFYFFFIPFRCRSLDCILCLAESVIFVFLPLCCISASFPFC